MIGRSLISSSRRSYKAMPDIDLKGKDPFPVGTSVDLHDYTFNCWRGAYVVVGRHRSQPLVRIENTQTRSKQYVSQKNLRPGRLAPFKFKI